MLKKYIYRVIVGIFCSGLVWLGISCSKKGTVETQSKIRHVILISIDTCRADHLSCYGYPAQTTPHIDALAQEGILFENVITCIPLTLPSHASMLTSSIPPRHGIHDNSTYQLGDKPTTLAEVMRDNGFATAAVVGAFPLDSQFGLDRGFDSYNDQFQEINQDFKSSFVERKASEVTRVANDFLDNNSSRPFFLFVHYFDPHMRYRPPEPFASQFPDSPYAGEIAYVDHNIGNIVARLKKLDIYDSSLIIVTADHGESFGEHQERSHGYYIYQSTLHVPLIIKLPGESQSQRVSSRAGLIDIMPTILGCLDIDPPQQLQGRDLTAELTDEPGHTRAMDRYYYCESLLPTMYECSPLFGVVTDRYKYIHTTQPELYDLTVDPGEQNNLAQSEPKLMQNLKNQLMFILEQSRSVDQPDNIEISNSDTLKRLQTLGYTGGSLSTKFELDPKKIDAKEFSPFFEKLRRNPVADITTPEEISRAKRIYSEILSKYPEIAKMYYLRAEIARKEGNNVEAVQYYNKYFDRLNKNTVSKDEMISIRPNLALAHNHLGVILLELGQYDKAEGHFRIVLQHEPDDVVAHTQLALVLAHQEKYDEAATSFQEALALEPDNLGIRADLGLAQSKQGLNDEAMACWQEGLRLSSSSPAAQAKLLSLMALQVSRQGEVKQAEGYWEKVLQYDPNNTPALYNMGIIANLQREHVLEISMYDKVLKLAPEHLGALNNLAWLLATGPDKISDPTRAMELAEKACQLENFTVPDSLDTLAVAYAAVGRFDKAIETAKKALNLAIIQNRKTVADQIKFRLSLYKKGKPYLEIQQ